MVTMYWLPPSWTDVLLLDISPLNVRLTFPHLLHDCDFTGYILLQTGAIISLPGPLNRYHLTCWGWPLRTHSKHLVTYRHTQPICYRSCLIWGDLLFIRHVWFVCIIFNSTLKLWLPRAGSLLLKWNLELLNILSRVSWLFVTIDCF